MANRKLGKFARTYNLTNFGVTADVVCPASKYTKIGELVVPAQQEVAWGNTDIINGGATGAPTYVALYADGGASGTAINGTVRFAISDANETDIRVIKEERTGRLSASSTGDRSIAVLFLESVPRAGEDSKLIIYFQPDGASSVTIDYNGTNTSATLPVTVYQ